MATATAVYPQNTKVVKYGYDGSSIASVGVAENSTSQNNRPTIQFVNRTETQQLLSKSTLSLNRHGLPGLTSTVIYDPKSSAATHHVQSDFSNLEWSGANRPSNGPVTATSINGKAGRRHETEFTYSQEQMESANINHFALDKGTPLGSTQLDFSGTVRLGSRICGGHLLITHKRSNGTVSACGTATMSNFGLISLLVMQTFDSDGTTLKQTSTWDYSSIAFNPRRKIESGKLSIKSADAQDAPLSTVTYTFEDGKATSVQVNRSDGTVSDYEYPVSKVSPVAQSSPQPSPAGPSLFQAVQAQQPNQAPSTGEPTEEQKKINSVKRPNGTVERVTEVWYAVSQGDGKSVEIPVRGTATLYATDGKTVIETKVLDFTKAQFGGDGRDITGSILVDSSSEGKALGSSTLNF